MSDYRINNIYSTDPYEWQDKVKAEIAKSDNSCVAIQVPTQQGKTYFCRERLIEFFKTAKSGETVLYYNPSRETAIHVANTLQILMLSRRGMEIERLGDFVIVHDTNKDVAAYFPLNRSRMVGYLESKIVFKEIIVDDADCVKSSILHNAILKAFLCDADIFLLGGKEEQLPHLKLTKNIWAWIINNPSFDVYVVSKPDPLKGVGADDDKTPQFPWASFIHSSFISLKAA